MVTLVRDISNAAIPNGQDRSGHHREGPRHLGNHDEDRQRRSRDAPEARHHPDDDENAWLVGHPGHLGQLAQPPDGGPREGADHDAGARSEERRVGKECTSRWWTYDEENTEKSKA